MDDKNITISDSFPPKGIDIKRLVLKDAVDVPNGGGQVTSMYSVVQAGVSRARSGVKMTLVPDQSIIYCEHKGAGFFVHLSNVKTGWF